MKNKIARMTKKEIQNNFDAQSAIAMAKSAPESGDETVIAEGFSPGPVVARGFAALKKHINKNGRPRIEDKKVVISIRLPGSDVEKLRALGKGWQTRVGDYLIQGIQRGTIMK